MEEQNPRLTRGLSPVYSRFITGTASALRCWLLTSVPTPICLCKPFSCKACPGITDIFNFHCFQYNNDTNAFIFEMQCERKIPKVNHKLSERYKPVESKTRTQHRPVGSRRRTAGRRGGAGLCRPGRRRVNPARGQPSLLPSSESKTIS